MLPNYVERLMEWPGFWSLRKSGQVSAEDIGAFPMGGIVEDIRSVGRWAVPRERASEFDWVAIQIRRTREARPPCDDYVFRRVEQFCRAVASIPDRLTYDSYVMLNLLLLAVEAGGQQDPDGIVQRCLAIARAIAEHLRVFEVRTMGGGASFNGSNVPPRNLLEKRINLLEVLLADLMAAEQALANNGRDSISGQADESLIDAMLLPESTYHDEVLFIRVLQVFELEFRAIIEKLENGVKELTAHHYPEGLAAIQSAVVVSHLFRHTMGLLGTLTPVSFLKFRDMTDGSSAVQSEQIKLIEVIMARPTLEREASEAFHHLPNVRRRLDSSRSTLLECYHAASADPGSVEWRESLREELAKLSENWISWKQMHLGVAVKTFKGEGISVGTGGTEGLTYLMRWKDYEPLAELRLDRCRE